MKIKTLSQIESEIEVHTLAIADLRKQGIALLGGSQPAEPKPRKPRAEKATSEPTAKVEKLERKPRADGLPARIVAVLNATALTFTADEMITKLDVPDEKAQQVRTTLCRLLKQGKIASVEKGVYLAAK